MNVTKCDWCGNEEMADHAERFWFHLERPEPRLASGETKWAFDKESCLAAWAAERAPTVALSGG